MTGFTQKRNLGAIKTFYRAIQTIKGLSVSKSLVERISSSGDSTGTPFYHFRWKLHNLADFVAYPETIESIQALLKNASKYKVSVTPRGSGSCYYGSGIPTNGGVVLDMKRMHQYEVDSTTMTVTVQTGMVFSNLMNILDREGLELPCYPTSAYTTTIGGWIGTGGSMGVGTLQNGGFIDQIVSMTVVSATGEKKVLIKKSDMEVYFGTNGTMGVVVEVKLKLVQKPLNETAMNFGFDKRSSLLNCVQELVKKTDPFLLRFSDKGHEYRGTGFSRYNYYLFVIYKGRSKSLEDELKECSSIVNRYSGVYLGDLYSYRTWEDYLKHEMKIKLDNPVLMLQQIYIPFEFTPNLIDKFMKLTRAGHLNHAFYGIINKDMNVRLVFYTPTDNDYWLHFIASKAALHKLVKYAYHLGGRVYTYGLQNTIYLHKYEKEKVKFLRKKKKELDPKFILNPLKVVNTKISFRRIDVMFELSYRWRVIAVQLGLAKIILSVDLNQRYGGA
ncbi:MAG: FAD-binding oxidoreductase [Candidatus Hodarchaeota archaeon]